MWLQSVFPLRSRIIQVVGQKYSGAGAISTIDSSNDQDRGTFPQSHSALSRQGASHGFSFPLTLMSLPVLPGEVGLTYSPGRQLAKEDAVID